MNLLLDTHAFLWWEVEPERLSAQAYAACRNPGAQLVLSVVSAWEMQIKIQLGKLKPRRPLKEIIERQRRQNGLIVLAVDLHHVLALANLPFHHKASADCPSRRGGILIGKRGSGV